MNTQEGEEAESMEEMEEMRGVQARNRADWEERDTEQAEGAQERNIIFVEAEEAEEDMGLLVSLAQGHRQGDMAVMVLRAAS